MNFSKTNHEHFNAKKDVNRNLKHVFGALILSAVLFTSCETNDDSDLETVKTVATAQEFSNIKAQALENQTQTFQFDGNDGNVSLMSDHGVQININTNCLSLNGNAVTGTIDLEYVELFEKGNMLTTNKPTMGVLPNGDKALLLSRWGVSFRSHTKRHRYRNKL
ncbi:hypothetical protein [Lacinutrix neustonica]|uniref:hypothetical protein n=1 Tax=Lacinutrix neustonica TaxID=2980107 RepID=UPI0028BDC4FE|nr:hypothetical protein [Lacinutrix neustonica]